MKRKAQQGGQDAPTLEFSSCVPRSTLGAPTHVPVSVASRTVSTASASSTDSSISSYDDEEEAPPCTAAVVLMPMPPSSVTTTYSSTTPRNAVPRRQGKTSMSEDSDDRHLNPLHCFVRKHVEFFEATPEDIAAPAPGRKQKATLGQVGIRCIHCTRLAMKHRVKRAVCYPPNMNGIYHAVSNMKFDHFGKCKGLPELARSEFYELRLKYRRHGTTYNSNRQGRGFANSSTAQYYLKSAKRKALVDSEHGIRFASYSSVVDRASWRGMQALMLAASQAEQLLTPTTNR